MNTFKSECCDETDKNKTEPQDKCKGDAPPKSKKMFSMAELAAIRKKNDSKPEHYSSKRPLRCPHIGCNCCISVFDLRNHFRHEHKEVPVIQTILDGRNSFAFYLKEISYGMIKCLGLLNVSQSMEKPYRNTTDSSQEKRQAGVTLAVLVSRVAPAANKIIVWTASNVACNNSCTVAVSNLSENVRVKYYGPVLQLGNNPTKLCNEGSCLILSHFHYLGISEKGVKPLKVDVVVHSED